MDGGTSPPGTLFTGCLRWLCQAKQAIYAGTDPLYQDALQHAWANKLPLSLFEVPQILKHKRRRKWVRKNKRMKCRSIEERPAVVNDGTEIGHWEVDTVVGQRAGREAVVFTAVEKVTRNYIAIRIPGRTCAGVEVALAQLQELYGAEYFSQIFKTMTADNGPEFENLSQF